MKIWSQKGRLTGLFMGITFALTVLYIQQYRTKTQVLGTSFIAQSIQDEKNIVTPGNGALPTQPPVSNPGSEPPSSEQQPTSAPDGMQL
jgi:hypothetical protein